MLLSNIEEYQILLQEIKDNIKTSQVKAIFAANQELILMYWRNGRGILERQKKYGWGAKVIPQLVRDLKQDYPNAQGLSKTNFEYMLKFASIYSQDEISQTALGKLTWYHNVSLFQKVKNKEERSWYAEKTLTHGWSRNVMLIHIERNLYKAEGNLPSNFSLTLPKGHSDLAQNTFKDPYILDFLNLEKDALERDIEEAMMTHITKFLLALGQGFAFMGRQYEINFQEETYRIDLLFYHTKLRCYVAIDIKARKFKPEDAGKINFYVNLVNDFLRHETDKPTIGIILCKDKDNVMAEYNLRTIDNPIGIAQYQLQKVVDEIQTHLPSIEALEAELRNMELPNDNQDDL